MTHPIVCLARAVARVSRGTARWAKRKATEAGGQNMIRGVVFALTAGLAVVAGVASAEISYVGSSTIGENIIPEAAKVFTAKTGIPFGTVEIQGSGKGLEKVLRGDAQLAGVSRALTLAEKQ